MIKFEAGKEYSTRSIGDHNCIFTIKVIKRTEKTVTIKDYWNHERRCKIYTDNNSEWIQPDKYSMAPSFHADNPNFY